MKVMTTSTGQKELPGQTCTRGRDMTAEAENDETSGMSDLQRGEEVVP